MTKPNYDKAFANLIDNYMDKTNFVTIRPAVLSDPENKDFDSENAWLFTGEALYLAKLCGQNLSKIKTLIGIGCILRQKTDDNEKNIMGLYRRQPYGENQFHQAMSWDENNGQILIDKALDGELELWRRVMWYMKKNDYIYNDRFPNISYSEIIKNKSIDKKEILGSIRQPRDRAFYKIANGEKPRLHELLHMCFATILTTYNKAKKREGETWLYETDFFKNKKINAKYVYRTSGVKMAWFRSQITKNYNKLTMLTHRIFIKRIYKVWGHGGLASDCATSRHEHPMQAIYKVYYTDKEHPLHTFIQIAKEHDDV